jgi:hypothetical protein
LKDKEKERRNVRIETRKEIKEFEKVGKREKNEARRGLKVFGKICSKFEKARSSTDI